MDQRVSFSFFNDASICIPIPKLTRLSNILKTLIDFKIATLQTCFKRFSKATEDSNGSTEQFKQKFTHVNTGLFQVHSQQSVQKDQTKPTNAPNSTTNIS